MPMPPPILAGKGGAPAAACDPRRVRWEIVLLSVAVAVGMALRLAPVQTGFWFDELFTAWAADPHLPLASIWPRIVADPQPPGYYTLMWAWHRLAGYEPAPSRLLGALAQAAALLATWAILARVLRPLALLAAVGALALAWFGIYYAHEARAYALLYALAAVGYALVLRALVLRRTHRQTAALLAVALAAGLMHYYGMVLGCALLLARAAGEAQRRVWPAVRADVGWAVALVGVYVLALAWQARHLGAPLAAPNWRAALSPLGHLQQYRYLLLRGRWGELGLLALTLAAVRPRELGRAVPFLAGIGASVAAPALVSLWTPILAARYLIITAPPLLVGVGIAGLGLSSTLGWPRILHPGWRETAILAQALHRPGCPLPVYAPTYPAGVYDYFLDPALRAAVVAVGPGGPLPQLPAHCRIRLWIGDDFRRHSVQPSSGTRVVSIGTSQLWLAPPR